MSDASWNWSSYWRLFFHRNVVIPAYSCTLLACLFFDCTGFSWLISTPLNPWPTPSLDTEFAVQGHMTFWVQISILVSGLILLLLLLFKAHLVVVDRWCYLSDCSCWSTLLSEWRTAIPDFHPFTGNKLLQWSLFNYGSLGEWTQVFLSLSGWIRLRNTYLGKF